MAQSRHKKGYNYISHDYLGTILEYKGKGVASMMFNKLQEVCNIHSYEFIVSVTHPRAISSVQYHCKRGFRILCKNYRGKSCSYSFIYPIKKFKFLNNPNIQSVVYVLISGIGYLRNKIRKLT